MRTDLATNFSKLLNIQVKEEGIMSDFSKKVCVACQADADPATEGEVRNFLDKNIDWSLLTIDGVNRIERNYSFDNFESALHFTNNVGQIAEDEGHHPLIILEWGKVTVAWWSHKIKDLHLNDLILASRCDNQYRKVQLADD